VFFSPFTLSTYQTPRLQAVSSEQALSLSPPRCTKLSLGFWRDAASSTGDSVNGGASVAPLCSSSYLFVVPSKRVKHTLHKKKNAQSNGAQARGNRERLPASYAPNDSSTSGLFERNNDVCSGVCGGPARPDSTGSSHEEGDMQPRLKALLILAVREVVFPCYFRPIHGPATSWPLLDNPPIRNLGTRRVPQRVRRPAICSTRWMQMHSRSPVIVIVLAACLRFGRCARQSRSFFVDGTSPPRRERNAGRR